jgi:hypothetical protein
MHYILSAVIALFCLEPAADLTYASPVLQHLKDSKALIAVFGDVRWLLLVIYLMTCHGLAAACIEIQQCISAFISSALLALVRGPANVRDVLCDGPKHLSGRGVSVIHTSSTDSNNQS